MQAGRMKYRLTLLEPQTVTTASGNEKTTYVATRTVWAERVKATGRRSEEYRADSDDAGFRSQHVCLYRNNRGGCPAA